MTWEEALGIKISVLLSGIAGGVVSLTYEDKIPPVRALGMIFCGGATAAYTEPLLAKYLDLATAHGNAIGFFLGLISMKLVHIILSLMDHVKGDPTILLKLVPYGKYISRSTEPDFGSSDPTGPLTETDGKEE